MTEQHVNASGAAKRALATLAVTAWMTESTLVFLLLAGVVS